MSDIDEVCGRLLWIANAERCIKGRLESVCWTFVDLNFEVNTEYSGNEEGTLPKVELATRDEERTFWVWCSTNATLDSFKSVAKVVVPLCNNTDGVTTTEDAGVLWVEGVWDNITSVEEPRSLVFLNTTEEVLKFDDMERNDTLFTASCEVLVVMETGRVKSVTFDEPDIVDNAIECREDTNGGETVSLDNE